MTAPEYGNAMHVTTREIDNIVRQLMVFNAAMSDFELSKANKSFIDAGYRVFFIEDTDLVGRYTDVVDDNDEPTGEVRGPYWQHAWLATTHDSDGIDITEEVRKESYDKREQYADIEQHKVRLGIVDD